MQHFGFAALATPENQVHDLYGKIKFTDSPFNGAVGLKNICRMSQAEMLLSKPVRCNVDTLTLQYEGQVILEKKNVQKVNSVVLIVLSPW